MWVGRLSVHVKSTIYRNPAIEAFPILPRKDDKQFLLDTQLLIQELTINIKNRT